MFVSFAKLLVFRLFLFCNRTSCAANVTFKILVVRIGVLGFSNSSATLYVTFDITSIFVNVRGKSYKSTIGICTGCIAIIVIKMRCFSLISAKVTVNVASITE